jgi:hypothetical protein
MSHKRHARELALSSTPTQAPTCEFRPRTSCVKKCLLLSNTQYAASRVSLRRFQYDSDDLDTVSGESQTARAVRALARIHPKARQPLSPSDGISKQYAASRLSLRRFQYDSDDLDTVSGESQTARNVRALARLHLKARQPLSPSDGISKQYAAKRLSLSRFRQHERRRVSGAAVARAARRVR